MKGAGSGIQCYAFSGAAIGGEFSLEGRHLTPEDELRTLEDTGYCRVNFRLDAVVLSLQVEIRDFDGDVCHASLDRTIQQNQFRINRMRTGSITGWRCGAGG